MLERLALCKCKACNRRTARCAGLEIILCKWASVSTGQSQALLRSPLDPLRAYNEETQRNARTQTLGQTPPSPPATSSIYTGLPLQRFKQSVTNGTHRTPAAVVQRASIDCAADHQGAHQAASVQDCRLNHRGKAAWQPRPSPHGPRPQPRPLLCPTRPADLQGPGPRSAALLHLADATREGQTALRLELLNNVYCAGLWGLRRPCALVLWCSGLRRGRGRLQGTDLCRVLTGGRAGSAGTR